MSAALSERIGGRRYPPLCEMGEQQRRRVPRTMMKNGARKIFDAIALHPYKKDADAVVAEVRKARELLDDLDAKRWKIRISEFGWATSGPPHKTHTVDEVQAGAADQEHAHEAGRAAQQAQADRRRLLRV